MTEPVTIEDYDPRWPEQFEIIRGRVAAVLGDMAAAIEHVGSTSVPGLAAKPILDIDVLLAASADVRGTIAALATLGYEHRGDLGIAGREAFRGPVGNFRHHLYVCPSDSAEYARHIAFRDYLRSHPEDAREYVRLKRRLAERFGTDREGYNLAKTEFVREVLRRAQDELRS